MALEMKKLGFTRVQPLLGGLNGWIDLGYPVEERELVHVTNLKAAPA